MRKHRLTKLREAVQKVLGVTRLSPEEDQALDEIRYDLMMLRFETRQHQCPPGCRGDGWHMHIDMEQIDRDRRVRGIPALVEDVQRRAADEFGSGQGKTTL